MKSHAGRQQSFQKLKTVTSHGIRHGARTREFTHMIDFQSTLGLYRNPPVKLHTRAEEGGATSERSGRVRGAASAAPTSPCCCFHLLPIRYALAAETLQSCAPLQPVLADVHPAHPHATRVLGSCAGVDAASGMRSGRSEAPDVCSVQCGDHANRKPVRARALPCARQNAAEVSSRGFDFRSLNLTPMREHSRTAAPGRRQVK